MLKSNHSYLETLGTTKLIALGTGVLGAALVFLLYRRNERNIRKKKRKSNINESLFFAPLVAQCASLKSGTKTSCRSLICNYCSYNKIVSYLDDAKHHIDVCVYLLTSEEICASLIKLFRKNVYVRIMVDKQMSDEAASTKVLIFRKECVPIKVIDTTQIMHNKFVIIDKEILITGSCNWTMQGFGGNYENAIITNNSAHVKKYLNYFEDLWDKKYETY